jgi:hypothetical protein
MPGNNNLLRAQDETTVVLRCRYAQLPFRSRISGRKVAGNNSRQQTSGLERLKFFGLYLTESLGLMINPPLPEFVCVQDQNALSDL